jgi:cytochrome c2
MQISKLLIAFLIGGILALNPHCQPDFNFQAPKKEVTKQPTAKRTTSPKVDANNTKINKGKTLFRNNCASCHNKNMQDDMTGPALAGVAERWSKYPKEDLYNYIRESQKMINSGHPQALIVWEDWKPNVMSNFPNLSDEDIEAILSYIKEDVSKR